jgi:predicted nucleic acid-binding Zn ribbon protein
VIERTCVVCNSLFLASSGGKKRIKCFECSPKRQNHPKPPEPRSCGYCRVAFVPLRRRTAQFCSSKCAALHRAGTVPLQDRQCQVCGGQVPAGSSVNCSPTCRLRASDATAKAKPGFVDRRREYQTAWLERSGRKSPNRDPNKVCPQCGDAGVGYQFEHCSRECAAAARRSKRPVGSCTICGGSIAGTGRLCSAKCRATHLDNQRSALTLAFRENDSVAVTELLLARSVAVGDCQQWTGSGKARPGKGGRYGYVQCDGRRWLVHRLMAQATTGGADLGHMPVHHKCGNSLCINPDHLQIVTPHENTAEMLERNSYLSRIADLEDALSSVSPNHPLLAERPRQLRIIA